MKQSSTLIPTMREVSSELDAKSLKMLLRAGFIRQSSSGAYSYLPLAKRLLTKIERIIREEIESIGAIEVAISNLQTIDLWEQSNRFEYVMDEVLTLQDRSKKQLLLAPSHEEEVTRLIRDEIQSYRKLPLKLYQIQTKYQEEIKSKYGILRNREFIINDTYSFHADVESLNRTYEEILQAYTKILNRLGLSFEIVQSDAGVIGDKEAQKLIIPSENGQTILATSTNSNYKATIDIAKTIKQTYEKQCSMKELEKIETPNIYTIEEVTSFFHESQENYIKSLFYKVDDDFVVALVRGDHQLNEVKLKNTLQATSVHLATESDIKEILGCSLGSIGPVKLPVNVRVIADFAIKSICNGVAGANEDGYHYINVNPERDFAINDYEDIRYVQEGEPCIDGSGTIEFSKGIEVGHLIKVGTHFSNKLKANFIDDKGETQPILMGSYSLGVSRLIAVISELNQDEMGFIWPKHFSPYDIHLIPVNCDDEIQWNLANELYNILTSYRFEVLFDDRDTSVGIKFIDADLIGLPIRVTLGKQASIGMVEVKIRRTGETFECAKEELVDRLNEFFRAQ